MAPALRAVFAQDVNLSAPCSADKYGSWCPPISWLSSMRQRLRDRRMPTEGTQAGTWLDLTSAPQG